MYGLREAFPAASEIEVSLAGFLQKRMQKELPVTGNPSGSRERVETAKSDEWCTMLSKPSVKVWSGPDAERLRRQHPDRFVGSRFVITEKAEDESSRIKARGIARASRP